METFPPFHFTEARNALKIVQVAHYYGPLGGIERVVHQFCQGLKTHFEVHALAANTVFRTERSSEEGIPVTRAARLAHVARMSVCPTFPLLLRQLKPDLVHVHMTNPLAESSFLLSGLRCPVVATYHMDVTRQKRLQALYRPLQRKFLNRARFITASSSNFAQSSPVLSQVMDKVRILPFGLAEGALRESPANRRLLDRLRAEIQKPVILFVGRLIHYKGVEVLVEAMKSIDGVCLIAGEGYLEDAIRDSIHRDRLEEKIQLLGRVSDDDLVAYYDRADVFVLPSVNRTEAYGLTQLEAMSRGTPVVSTEVGTGTSFVNEHEVSGLVVLPNDPKALEQSINRILSDPTLAGRLSEGARWRTENLFSESKMIDTLLNYYQELDL